MKLWGPGACLSIPTSTLGVRKVSGCPSPWRLQQARACSSTFTSGILEATGLGALAMPAVMLGGLRVGWGGSRVGNQSALLPPGGAASFSISASSPGLLEVLAAGLRSPGVPAALLEGPGDAG